MPDVKWGSGDVRDIIRAIQELVYCGTGCFCQGEDLLHDRYLHHDVNRDHFHEHLLALVLVEIWWLHQLFCQEQSIVHPFEDTSWFHDPPPSQELFQELFHIHQHLSVHLHHQNYHLELYPVHWILSILELESWSISLISLLLDIYYICHNLDGVHVFHTTVLYINPNHLLYNL